MLIELHSHTHYSHQKKIFYDGTCTPQEMVSAAKKLGLGALAITDHDSMEGVLQAMKIGKKFGIIIIPGEEISTLDGHCLALGISEAITPHKSLEDTIDNIHSQGGLAVSSHPFDIKKDGLREMSRLCDAIEVFNALNIDRITNNAARNFAKIHGLIGTAGSDAHHTSMIGWGTIAADAHDAEGILKSIRKNSFHLAVKYPPVRIVMNYAILRMKMSYDYTSAYIEKNYPFPKKQIARSLLGMVNKSPGKIDYMFRGMAYASFAGIFAYSAIRHAARF